MLYCPLQVTYERFLKRDKSCNNARGLAGKAVLRQLVGSFFSLYQINPQPAQPIELVNKNELDQVIDAMACTLKDQSTTYQKPVFTFNEVSKDLFLKMKTEFLLPFEADGSRSRALYVSKEEQDIIIDNSKEDLQMTVRVVGESALK